MWTLLYIFMDAQKLCWNVYFWCKTYVLSIRKSLLAVGTSVESAVLCATAEQPLLGKLLQNVLNYILFLIFILQLRRVGHLSVSPALWFSKTSGGLSFLHSCRINTGWKSFLTPFPHLNHYPQRHPGWIKHLPSSPFRCSVQPLPGPWYLYERSVKAVDEVTFQIRAPKGCCGWQEDSCDRDFWSLPVLQKGFPCKYEGSTSWKSKLFLPCSEGMLQHKGQRAGQGINPTQKVASQ